MENVIKMLRMKLRNERIYRAEARQWLKENLSPTVKPSGEWEAFSESLEQGNRMIPQLEKAIKILTEWKDK